MPIRLQKHSRRPHRLQPSVVQARSGGTRGPAQRNWERLPQRHRMHHDCADCNETSAAAKTRKSSGTSQPKCFPGDAPSAAHRQAFPDEIAGPQRRTKKIFKKLTKGSCELAPVPISFRLAVTATRVTHPSATRKSTDRIKSFSKTFDKSG